MWENPSYPQYYIPLADVRPERLGRRGHDRGDVPGRRPRASACRSATSTGPGAARVLTAAKVEGLDDTVRFEWSALDAWFEEDEQVFVHPRNPYVRVDALRSCRAVRVEEKGVVLAESSSPVLVFETGLPTRYYMDRTDVDFTHLVPSDTETACPYKGSRAATGRPDRRPIHPDIAWSYDFPIRELLPIAGLIAFYNEKIDLFVDDVKLERPHTRIAPSR